LFASADQPTELDASTTDDSSSESEPPSEHT
jgi:hypothetical protein